MDSTGKVLIEKNQPNVPKDEQLPDLKSRAMKDTCLM